jgi:hypothetical protein
MFGVWQVDIKVPSIIVGVGINNELVKENKQK